jgi:hypothetical protein
MQRIRRILLSTATYNNELDKVFTNLATGLKDELQAAEGFCDITEEIQTTLHSKINKSGVCCLL